MLKVTKVEDCGLILNDVKNYPAASLLNDYAFLDSYTIHFIYRLDSECDKQLVYYNLLLHSFNNYGLPTIPQSKVKLKEDGFYEIVLYILPTKEFAEWALDKNLINTKYFYFIDNENLYTFYKRDQIKKISFKDLEFTADQSNMFTGYCKIFSTCELSNAFLKALDGKNSDIKNMFLISLDSIKYCLHRNMYWEALLLIKLIKNCGVLSEYFEDHAPVKGNCGCGCKG